MVSANKTVNKLLRQVSNGRYRHQIPKILFLIIYIYTASWSCRVVDLKLPIGAATSAAAAGLPDNLNQTLGHWTSQAYRRYIRTAPDTF